MSDASGGSGKGLDIMAECDADEAKASAPTQQLQQAGPLQSTKDEGARAGLLPAGMLSGGGRKQRPGGEEKDGFDEARFTAGIGRFYEFYESILKEPVPEKMLRLIDEIAKRERGS
jgi:hypothetical protein